MKSRTSFFNTTVLRKDITRFAPVWGLYSVLVGLFLLLWWEIEASPARFANTASDIFLAMGAVNFFYAPLAAFLLFGDLFKSRMCNALHALPMRREGWFLTHFTAGMLFCIVPNTVAALLTGALLQEYAWMAFLWLGLMVLQYLFFFGVAVFATQCSGNMLGAIAVYSIVNFLAFISGWLVTTFYEPLLYGVKLDFQAISEYSPLVRFCLSKYVQTHFDNMTDKLVFDGFVGADWRFLGISAGVGLVLLGLSVLLYRKRQLESAGDLIAFKPAAPVFLVIYTLCVGAVLYTIADALTGLGYLFLMVGLAVGFFTGRMLLERKVKVFRGKSFLAFGIIVAVFFASLGITKLDPLGITRYVPETNNVSYVQVCSSHYVYDLNRSSVALTDPADIETVAGIHKDCIKNPVSDKLSYRSEYTPVYIRYEMKNGTYMERYYYVAADSAQATSLRTFFSSEKAIFGSLGADQVLERLQMIEVYDYDGDHPLLAISTSQDALDLDYYTEKYGDSGKCLAYYTDDPAQDDVLKGLFAALKQDCDSGKLAQSGMFYNTETWGHITLRYSVGGYIEYLDIDIFAGCENTIAYLKSLQPADKPTPEG